MKKTSARTIILKYLEKQRGPVFIDQIYTAVKKEDINQSTVYRTINFFLKEKIIRTVSLSKDKLYIELERNDDHHHIVCTDCGKIDDFKNCPADTIIKSILKKNQNFSRISTHTFELFGICKNCT